jgi:hypothetical protein
VRPGVTVRPEGGHWYAVSSESGGYAVPYPDNSDTLSVVISGGVLANPGGEEDEE